MSIAAVYGRKSLFTGKGDSIKNQIDGCREYALSKNWEIIEYRDEGFSGKDTDRPGFQSLIKDIESKRIDHVIFYKLDRISRSMLDILDFIELTNKKGIDFISITENFDTTTPLGRAMIHIAATFAQLEREMLQQRVRDNMLRLAKSGRWLGGITPTGYCSIKTYYSDEQGKTKFKYTLKGVEEELVIVETIYQKYLELKSLRGVQEYLHQHNIKTKMGNDFHKQTIKGILTNPVYVKADPVVYQYFKDIHGDMANTIDEFDGIHGILTYNKNMVRKGQKNEIRSPEDWVISIGGHKGIIGGGEWIRVQKILSRNKIKHPRQNHSDRGLLIGLLQCQCGELMKIKYGNKQKHTQTPVYYYGCRQKRKGHCVTPNIRGDLLDKVVLKELHTLPWDRDKIKYFLEKKEELLVSTRCNYQRQEEGLKQLIEEKEKHIQGLMTQLQSSPSPMVTNRIIERLEKIDTEILELHGSLGDLQQRNIQIRDQDVDLNKMKEALLDFPKIIVSMKNSGMLRTLVEEITDKMILSREQLIIHFNGYGTKR